MHKKNAYVTLTYNKKNLPEHGSLQMPDFQKFLKRLRKKRYTEHIKAGKTKESYNGFRYFHCGEYGTDGRPHYHACLFGIDFKDQTFYKNNKGNELYISQELEDVWGHGFCTVGKVTYQSAAYIARYVLKKITGEKAKEHYKKYCKDCGKDIQLKPEYLTMSRRPNGIGADWFKKYKNDVYPSDEVIHEGKKHRPPKYYDQLLDEEELLIYKAQRMKRRNERDEDETVEKLYTKKKILEAQLELNKKTL